MQHGDSFIVSMLCPTNAVSGPAFEPTTLTIEAQEIRAEIALLRQPPSEPPKKSTGWLNR